jgi:uncharacterized DUF497 family protein
MKMVFRRNIKSMLRLIFQQRLYDQEHSDYEDRWITIGLDETGILRVVIHTFEQTEEDSYLIRIISARKATFNEQQYYQGGKL